MTDELICREMNAQGEPCKARRTYKDGLCYAHWKKVNEGPEVPKTDIISKEDETKPPPDDTKPSGDETVPPAITDPDAPEDPKKGEKLASYPSKSRCPKCNGSDTHAISTDKKVNKQYRECRAPKPGQKCPRGSYPHYRIDHILKREKNKDPLYAIAECSHPIHRGEMFQVTLCGHRYSVDADII